MIVKPSVNVIQPTPSPPANTILPITSLTLLITPLSSATSQLPTQQLQNLDKQRYLIIGLVAGGGLLILILSCLVITVSLIIHVKKNKTRTQHSSHRNQVTQLETSSSFLSLLPLDTVKRNNLLAFKRQETAQRNVFPHKNVIQMNKLQEAPEVEDYYSEITPKYPDTKIDGPDIQIPAQNSITMKANPSYSVLPITAEVVSEDDGHGYDVPMSGTSSLPPREYEVPAAPSETYDDIITSEDKIYEVIH